MTKVIMHGCNGKMGQVITGLIAQDEDVKIVAGIDTYDEKKNDYPVYRVLKDSKTWSNVYEGKRFGVFVKKDQAKAKYKMPTNDTKYYNISST